MLIEVLKPLIVRMPDRDINLNPGQPMDFPEDHVHKLLELAPTAVRLVTPSSGHILDTAIDAADSIFAVKLGGSVIGEFWFCVAEAESFDPGDGLPVYRPSEIKALAGRNYEPVALQAIDKVKTIFNGTVHS